MIEMKVASLKNNIVANCLGQGWRALMGIAFIPLYIRYLGVEAYGLIGIFTLLLVWLSLLDMGMKPALGREMARFTGGAHTAQSIRDLLRSVELVGIAIAGLIALSSWAASGWLAANWLRAGKLPVGVVANAIAVMGVVVALRFVEDIYASSIAGLQRQVQQNVVTSVMASARGLGVVGVLAWVSPTVGAFFMWQGLISLMTVALFARIVYRALPPAPRPARLSGAALMSTRNFATGVMAITGLTLLLSQVDKILLSRLLTLKAFGYYTLAGVLASGLYALTAPITGAFYPHFAALASRRDEVGTRAAYHQGAQLVTVLMGSAAVILAVFRDRVMLLWTGDPALVEQAATLMGVLTLGAFINCLMWIPYQMQLAHGWTTLTIKVNAIAVCIVVPAILWVVPRYGAIGAAWIWAILNAGCLVFSIALMHRRLLTGEKWRWWRNDLALPLAAATGAGLLCRLVFPANLGRIGELAVLLAASCCVFAASALSAPDVRERLARVLRTSFHKTPLRTDRLANDNV